MGFGKVLGALFGYGWLWGSRKPAVQEVIIRHQQQQPRRRASAEGVSTVKVVTVSTANRYAFMEAEDGTRIYCHFDVAEAGGITAVNLGDRYHGTWGKSRRKSGRLDMLTLSRIKS